MHIYVNYKAKAINTFFLLQKPLGQGIFLFIGNIGIDLFVQGVRVFYLLGLSVQLVEGNVVAGGGKRGTAIGINVEVNREKALGVFLVFFSLGLIVLAIDAARYKIGPKNRGISTGFAHNRPQYSSGESLAESRSGGGKPLCIRV